MLGKSPRSYSFQQIILMNVMYGECNLNDIKAIQVKFLEISGKIILLI